MEISLLQVFVLGIIVFIVGLDMFNGLIYMYCLVVFGLLVGLVFGDLYIGILIGGMLELVWMGLVLLVGVQLFNVIIGIIVGMVFVIIIGVKFDVVVGVVVFFVVVVQMGIIFLFLVMFGVMFCCDWMVENVDICGIECVNYLVLLVFGIFYFFCVFLFIYFGVEHVKIIIDVLL